jgi:uncharacterized RDD family membrane protein YckC
MVAMSIAYSPFLGEANKERVFAAVFDNFMAAVVAAIVAVGTKGVPDVVWGIIAAAAYLGYYFLAEGLLSATPGKFLFGLRVRSVCSGKCTWLQIGIRTLLRLVEVDPILLGGVPAGIFILTTEKRQRLGDLIAGTVVVSTASIAQRAREMSS